MINDLSELNGIDASHQFLGAENPFPCRAPDIDPLRIEDENPEVEPFQLATNNVKTIFMICGCNNIGIGIRIANGIKTRAYCVIISEGARPAFDMLPILYSGPVSRYFGNRSGR
jgi:hypothetical protein